MFWLYFEWVLIKMCCGYVDRIGSFGFVVMDEKFLIGNCYSNKQPPQDKYLRRL